MVFPFSAIRNLFRSPQGRLTAPDIAEIYSLEGAGQLWVLRRSGDMAEIVLRFGGAQLKSGAHGQTLERVVATRPLTLTAWFRPQHLSESGRLDPFGLNAAPSASLSGWSRIAVRQPAGAVEGVPLSAAAVLQMLSDWPLQLGPNARPGTRPVESPKGGLQGLGLTTPHLSAIETALFDAGASAGRRFDLSNAGGRRSIEQAARKALSQSARQLRIDTPVIRGGARVIFDRGLASIHSVAEIPPGKPGAPALNETALELPSRLYLSPTRDERFRHRLQPFQSFGRTELWHTRLSLRTSDRPGGAAEASRDPAGVRPIWTPDYKDNVAGTLWTPFLIAEDTQFAGLKYFDLNLPVWPITADQRSDLVHLGADYATTVQGSSGAAWTPLPARVRRLELSALGGFMDLDGSWPEPLPIGVSTTAWKHRLSLGRDSRVEVVEAGVLAPFGHRAVLITVTEREVEPTPTNLTGNVWTATNMAVLVQRKFLTVVEPVKRFAPDQLNHEGREFPLTSVEILNGPTQIVNDGDVIWPRSAAGAGATVSFDVRATDAAGRIVRFRLPMVFAKVEVSSDPNRFEEIKARYKGDIFDDLYCAATAGQSVQLAPDPRDSLSFPTRALRFAIERYTASDVGGIHRFRPRLALAEVEAPGSAEFAGGARIVDAVYPEIYRDNGFAGANKGEVALALTSPLALFASGSGVPADKAGPVAAPQVAVQGFSRRMGAVTGPVAAGSEALAEVAGGTLKPATLIPDMKLLGAFNLADLLGDFSLPSAELPPAAVPGSPSPEVSLNEAMRLKQERTADGGHVAILSFNQSLKALEGPLAFLPIGESRLLMDARTLVPAGGGAPRQSVNARVTHFAISFFDVIELRFERLAFIINPGSKPDFDLVFTSDRPLRFKNELSFLQQLADILPTSAFSDPPDLQITSSGVVAGYSLGLPPVQVGALALSNIAFGARFELPFLGDAPSLRLNFAERHSPFGILVACLGGGGYFAVELNAKGLKAIEGTLEAQAGIAVNLGVAAGAVQARLGIYYRWEAQATPAKMTLEAFAELRGELCVLGLISVSITFHVGLLYQQEGDQKLLAGVASITVEIELLFFSKSVSVSCERKFLGCNGDPAFADVFPQKEGPWTEYALAFE